MSYYLKKPPNKDGTQLIYLQRNYHAIRLIISTGLNIKPEFWDKRTERVKRQFRYAKEYNAILDKYEDVTERSYLEIRINGVPSKEALKAEVLRRMEPNRPETIHEYASRYVANHPTYGPKTRQAFERLAEIIKEFDPKLTFADLSRETMEDFREWLFAKNWEVSTVGKVYQRFKTVCNDATERGINTNLSYKTKKVSVAAKDTTQVFLDLEELDKIWRLKLEGYEELARDLFLVSCFTGTRYQDIFAINKSVFYEDAGTPYFKILDQKQANQAVIPAHPTVMSIMTRYDWKLPTMSNSALNEYIKVVVKKAKINRQVVVTTNPGNKTKKEIKEKWELCTCHTGRRSLISNLYLSGVPVETIKTISGHRSHSAFLRYLKLSNKDHLAVAFKSDFFKTTKLKSV